MRSLSLLSALLAPLALVACGGADAAPAPRTGTAPAATAAPDPVVVAACETFFARQRTCTDQFIPALVDLRIELDKPVGIAEAARIEGRDAIIAQAMAEWADDSQPAAVTATCAQIAGSMPPAQLEGMRAGAEACMALADCGEFATCAIELQRPRMAGQ